VRGYYAKRLSGRCLRQCYELAPARVRQYLESEIRHVLGRLQAEDVTLELGCGYGRVAGRLAERVNRVVGIDVAVDSLILAKQLVGDSVGCEFIEMDASNMGFVSDAFDVVICIQNGLCAFGTPEIGPLREALRVARPDGRVLFSTYSDSFWGERLKWFERQAAAGLVGRIDRAATRPGVIVCEDGFEVATISPGGLTALCAALGVVGKITEVDESSLFCEVVKPRVA
jgi:SAM-dependent methyltransferase